MEPKFNSSFIPKKPVLSTEGPVQKHSASGNIFNTGASVLFILTLLAFGGLFVYKNLLINQIAQADKDIDASRPSLEIEKINKILDDNSRIAAVRNLLEKHVAVSEFLKLLQSLTVKTSRLTDLTYINKGSSPNITMSLESQSYNSLALQSDIFNKNEFIKDEAFVDFDLTTPGIIKTKFIATLDPSLVSYKKAIEALSLNR